MIRLVSLDPAVERAISEAADYKDALAQENWAQAAAVVHRIAGRTPAVPAVNTNDLRWQGYFAADERTGELVGLCAFKRPPSDDGDVEIAYFTFPSFEGRGYATAMARALVDFACQSPAVRRVVAHTLPQKNASCRVLEKAGMTFVGEVTDPDDGQVWQWEMVRQR